MKKAILFITSACIGISLIGCAKSSSKTVNNTFNENKAILMVIKEHTNFPAIPSKSIIKELPTGGPQGSTTKVKFTTEVEKSSKSAYVVTLIKDWGITVNKKYVKSSWTYKVTPNGITLLKSNDNDNLINSMK